MESAKQVIESIFEIKTMSMSKLASKIMVKPSTVSRILNGKTGDAKLVTYMRLIEYKNKLSKDYQEIHGGSQ